MFDLFKKYKGTLKAIGMFSISLLKAMCWGYTLGNVAGNLINKGKSNKTKILIAIPASIGVLGINKLFAWHESEIVTPKCMEYLDENEETDDDEI